MEEFEGLIIPLMSKSNEESFCSEEPITSPDIDCEWDEIYKTTPAERKITNGRNIKK